MGAPKSLLVQSLTAATDSYPEPYASFCMNALGFTLERAGFSNVELSENPEFGHAIECDHGPDHHVTLVLILSPDAYETSTEEVEAYARLLMDADDHLGDLVAALNGAVLDVASVCLDVVGGRCRIHHPKDLLGTSVDHYPCQHFFIPAGTDTVIPAEEATPDVMRSPFAIASVLSAV
ncbi:MAG: hypothetical protein J6S63_07250 [Atopobiaceae bacterium]|nr:hypothetical protein [Atopobiaceae bacterium]